MLVPRKVIEVPALNIQHADTLPLQHQRHGQFRLYAVNRIDIPRILGSIADSHGVARGRRRPGNPLPHGNPQIVGQLARIADGKSVPEVTSVTFDHQHAKNFIVNVPFDQSRRSRQDLVQIQRAVHTSAEISAPPLNAVAVVCSFV